MIFLVALLFFGTRLYGELLWPNLEARQQAFVLETKQIHIPGHLEAFNPSLIRFGDRFLLCFRTRRERSRSTNPIGFVYLNEAFELEGEVQIVDLEEEPGQPPSFIQDPRLISVGDELFMVYSNLAHTEYGDLRRVFIAKIEEKRGLFCVGRGEPLISFEGSLPKVEKNWTPFETKEGLLLSYSLSPHKVFKPLEKLHACETLCETENDIFWQWGEVRGGTQAFLQEDGEYLAFFHSSQEMKTLHSLGKKITHYFIGAYTFSGKPPFEIRSISREPIFAKGFYSCAREYPTWKPLRVVFPCGYIFDKEDIWVAYGRQDCEVWVMKLDKQTLRKELVPVRSKEKLCRDSS